MRSPAELETQRKHYAKALDQDLDSLMAQLRALSLDRDPRKDSEAYERLEFLSVLVEAYEDAHLPIYELPTPQEVVAFMMDQKGLTRADLAVWVGGKSRASEFLNGIRSLSMRQIQALRENLGIPADLLIDQPERT